MIHEGKVAVITGGSRGIGFAIARELLDEGGGKVMITGRREDVLKQAADELGDGVLWRAGRVDDEQSAEECVQCDGPVSSDGSTSS